MPRLYITISGLNVLPSLNSETNQNRLIPALMIGQT